MTAVAAECVHNQGCVLLLVNSTHDLEKASLYVWHISHMGAA